MSNRIFGFGSLVSLASIEVPVVACEPTRVFGYRREWCQPFSAHGQRFASLGLQGGQPSDFVDGVTLTIEPESMAYFEAREAGYRHVEVEAVHRSGEARAAISFVTRNPADALAMIPVSYLATVTVGFREAYGMEEGLNLFIDNTGGWDKPVLFDVARPVYSRRPDNLAKVAAELRPRLEAVTRIIDP